MTFGSLGVNDPTEANSRRKAYRRTFLRWAGSGAALLLLLLLLPVDELISALGRIPALTWSGAILVFLLLHSLGVMKWRTMVNASEGELGKGAAVRCYYYGLFGNTFLPSLVGGDLIRAGLAMRLSPSPSGVVVGSLMDRMLDVVALASVAVAGILLVPRTLGAVGERPVWVVVSGLAVAGLLGAVVLAVLPTHRLPKRVRSGVEEVRRGVHAMARRPATVSRALLMAVTLQVSLVLLNAWLGHEVGIEVPLATWFFVWPIAKLSALLPFTQGGLGVREAALAGLFSPFGVAPALAVAAGLVFQGVIISGGLFGGGIAFVLGRLERSRRSGSGV